MAHWPAEPDGPADMAKTPVFDPVEFAMLADALGEDGVREVVWIFETETRDRLRRLSNGGQDRATIVRELHTLKGAAATVASPRLTEIGRALEQLAREGVTPVPRDLAAIAAALDAYMREIEVLGLTGPEV